MGALTHVDEPAYAGLLLRRTYADLSLPGAIMDRLADWLRPTAAEWHAETKTWTFPAGSSITFGYLEHEEDKRRYAGIECQYIGFDEATTFTSTQYLFLQSRLRRGILNKVQPISRAATNPGGISHDFFFNRFVNPETRAPGCVFLPAKLKDNPHVDIDEYRKALSRLDPTTRSQLEDGIWVRDSGGQLHAYDVRRNRVPCLPQLPAASEWRYNLAIDLGSSLTSPTTAFVLVCWHEHSPNVYVPMSYSKAGMIPSTIAEDIQAISLEFPLEHIYMDQGGLGGGYIGEIGQRWGIPIEPVQKRDKLGYRRLLNGALTRGELLLVEGQNHDLEDELVNLQWNEKGTDAQSGQPDHCSDALLYAWRGANAFLSTDQPPPPPTDQTSVYTAYQASLRQKAIDDSLKRKNRKWFER